jgi:hypothetical protein
MIGTADDDRKLQVAVSPDVLEKYAGMYQIETPRGTRRVTVYLRDGELALEIENGPTITAIALSETRFAAQGVAIEFVPRPDGVASELVVTAVEGDFKAVRTGEQK